MEQIDAQPVSQADSLSSDDPRTALIERLCPRWQPRQARFEQSLEGGYRNRNYRFAYHRQDYVLRVPGADTGIDREAEQKILVIVNDAFAPNQTPHAETYRVPELVAFDANNGTMISRFCPWPLLAERPGVSGNDLGYYLAGLHRRLERLSPRLRPHIQHSPRCETTIVADLRRAGATAAICAQVTELTLGQRTQLSHQDLNPWNLLVDNSVPLNWMTLDWETLGPNVPLFDLVSLLEGYGLAFDYGRPALDELRSDGLRAYNGARQSAFNRSDYRQAQTLFCWREYAWAAAQLKDGNRREEITEQYSHYAALLVQQGFAVIQS